MMPRREPASPDSPNAGGNQPGLPGLVELGLALTALALVGAFILGGHVLHGGLYTDDWPIASIDRFYGTGGLIHSLFLGDHSRPLAAVYLGLAETFTGTSGHGHALFGLGLHVLACWSLYWLLRTLSLTGWQAGTIALLLLLFPASDSTWLWFAITQSCLSLLLATLGLTALTCALRSTGRRAISLQGVAVLCVTGSVLTYETAVVVLVIAVIAITLKYQSGRRARLWSSLPSIAGVALAALIPRIPGLLPGIEPHQGISLGQQFKHAWKMASQSATVLTNSAVPFGAPHRNVVVSVVGTILIVSLVARRRAAGGSPLAPALRRWLIWMGAGFVVLLGAYAVFINANPAFYEPAAEGSDNRINVVAAIGYCLTIYGAAMLAGALLTRGRRPRIAAVISSVLALLVVVGYAHRVLGDVNTWDHAASIQRSELATLSHSLPKPARGTTIYTYGGVGVTGTGVYAFRVTWDLNSAVELLWEDRTLRAYPIFAGTNFVCGSGSLYPVGFDNGDGPAQRAAYGHAMFFDFRTGQRLQILSRPQCLSAQRQFQPGPLT